MSLSIWSGEAHSGLLGHQVFGCFSWHQEHFPPVTKLWGRAPVTLAIGERHVPLRGQTKLCPSPHPNRSPWTSYCVQSQVPEVIPWACVPECRHYCWFELGEYEMYKGHLNLDWQNPVRRWDDTLRNWVSLGLVDPKVRADCNSPWIWLVFIPGLLTCYFSTPQKATTTEIPVLLSAFSQDAGQGLHPE